MLCPRPSRRRSQWEDYPHPRTTDYLRESIGSASMHPSISYRRNFHFQFEGPIVVVGFKRALYGVEEEVPVSSIHQDTSTNTSDKLIQYVNIVPNNTYTSSQLFFKVGPRVPCRESPFGVRLRPDDTRFGSRAPLARTTTLAAPERALVSWFLLFSFAHCAFTVQ
jgi:hypothetical protein